jgi:hypothetical protein
VSVSGLSRGFGSNRNSDLCSFARAEMKTFSWVAFHRGHPATCVRVEAERANPHTFAHSRGLVGVMDGVGGGSQGHWGKGSRSRSRTQRLDREGGRLVYHPVG